jgi:peptide/nickel transport system ATP-binding protein|tara:strand:+ start:444 stop:1475 length:1032 start_codon:yes stop_codon:yes gene_type:complete
LTAVLEVEDLTIDIPISAGMLHPVRGISFHVDRGETLAIVGESGCGKSLTSLAVMGLLPKTADRRASKLNFHGQSLLDYSEGEMSDIRGDRMSMIFQDPMTSLNPTYSIGNQLEEAMLRHRKVSRREARDRAVLLLEKVGITAAESRLKQYPHQLSGGLRQRVMIAMALMCDPELLIADEPTTALDVTIQAQILLLIANIQKEFDIGVIVITHDLGVVARVADRVAVMYAGHIVETGTGIEIYEKPLHPYTQGLLDCIPIPGKTQPGNHLGSIPGIVPTLVGDLSGCTFRDRCPFAHDGCVQDVDEHIIGPGRGYRCNLPEDMSQRVQTQDFGFGSAEPAAAQ